MEQHLIELCRHQPWLMITTQDLGHALNVPTMLNREEQQLYCWLAKTIVQPKGHIVDLGSFVGGSTAALAAGADKTVTIHAFDRFTAKDQTKENQLYSKGIPKFEGNDILPLSRDLLAPYAPCVEFYKGNIGDQSWSGLEIDVLTLDASKEPKTMDGMAKMFFPHLVAGHSVIVQQDFLHWRQPWIPAQMVRMKEFFTPIAMVPSDSISFLCTKTPTVSDCAAMAIDTLTDVEIHALLDEAVNCFSQFAPAQRFRHAQAALRSNPGVRISWQLKPPERWN